MATVNIGAVSGKRLRIKGKTAFAANGQRGVMVVTKPAASVIGRVTADVDADKVFRERVADEVRQYREQVSQAHLNHRNCKGEAGWDCRLCPYKHFRHKRHLLEHLDNQHQGGVKHPLRNFVAFAKRTVR